MFQMPKVEAADKTIPEASKENGKVNGSDAPKKVENDKPEAMETDEPVEAGKTQKSIYHSLPTSDMLENGHL